MESDPDDCIFENDDQGVERRMVSASPQPHHMEIAQNGNGEDSSNDEAMDENISATVHISGIPVSIAPDMHGDGQTYSTQRHQSVHLSIHSNNKPDVPSPEGSYCEGKSPLITDGVRYLYEKNRAYIPDKTLSNFVTPLQHQVNLSENYVTEREASTQQFDQWTEHEQVDFVQRLILRMCHDQHGQLNSFLKPMLQRDFISALPAEGLSHIAEKILVLLDARSLCRAERVCREWYRVIQEGNIWKRLVDRNVRYDRMWAGLAVRMPWGAYLQKKKDDPPDDKDDEDEAFAASSPEIYWRSLYPVIVRKIGKIEDNWRQGRFELNRIMCQSENSKGVYCLQYDDDKIVSGLRDNTIKLWKRNTLENYMTLTGHTGSVLCLQYDETVIITGSSDSTVRVWDIGTYGLVNTLVHHCEAVLHLRFDNGLMVTCSKDRSIAVWDMVSAREINMRRVLVGHRAAVNVVDFDDKYIVSASGDRTIKVWNTDNCEFVRTLNGHKRGIACLQYRDQLVVSGSSDNTIRLWDIESGACLRILEGHEELVRCIRFDNKRIVSGAYDGKIKVWDLKAALDQRSAPSSLCLRTLEEHTGRVFRLQFDEFQIVSSSHDDSILIWDFLNVADDKLTVARTYTYMPR